MGGALLAAAAVVLLPGAGAALAAWRPGEAGLVTRLALAFGFGYAITGGVAFVLALAHILSLPVLLPLLGVITVGLWALASRRGGLRAHVKALGEELRGDPWTLGAGLLVTTAAGATVLFTSPLVSLTEIAPFRYWVDGLELATAGRIPQRSLMYGSLYPTATSKSFLNAFNGATILGAGREPLPVLWALLCVGVVGLVLALWAFGREMGLRRTAPLLPLVLFFNRLFLSPEASRDITHYKAETFGRLVAVCVLVLGVRAFRDREGWRDPVLAGAMAGVAAGTHLVPLLIAGLFLAWYGLTTAVVDRRLRASVGRGAVMLGAAVIVTAAVLWLPPGEIGFTGAESTGGYPGAPPGFDPTLYFNTGVVDQPAPPEGWYFPPGEIAREFVHRGVNPPAPLQGVTALAGPIVGVALALVMLWRFPRAIRPLGVVAVGLALSMVLIAFLFSWRYDVYVLARFGVRRVFDYASLPVVILGLAIVEAGVEVLGRVRRWAPSAVGALVVVATTAVLIPTAWPRGAVAGAGRRALGPLSWVSSTSCDARILANQRTTGVFRAMTGRVAVLEGMGPFLRPRMLEEVVTLALGARAFYEDPEAHGQFLKEEGIEVVLVLKGLQLGPPQVVGDVDPSRLQGLPFLDRVYSSPRMDAYRVLGPTTGTSWPDPADHPGYECRRTPLPTPP